MNTKLRTARESVGKTQQQVAEEVGITVRGYQDIEAKENYQTVHTAIRIAKALGSTVETLFGDGC